MPKKQKLVLENTLKTTSDHKIIVMQLKERKNKGGKKKKNPNWVKNKLNHPNQINFFFSHRKSNQAWTLSPKMVTFLVIKWLITCGRRR